MRICLMIEGQEGVTWNDWLALARAAEAAGLDGLFRSDHYSSFWRAWPPARIRFPAAASKSAWAQVGTSASTHRMVFPFPTCRWPG
jgi:alkanesulfonate monooxygenase SsuD/methylene tetrahydromethanopterin reductase-like flavin-dependent oxidoreductase (luciferase family)